MCDFLSSPDGPTGLWPKAQGWCDAPTLGNVSVKIRFNPNGVVSTVECEGWRNPVVVGEL